MGDTLSSPCSLAVIELSSLRQYRPKLQQRLKEFLVELLVSDLVKESTPGGNFPKDVKGNLWILESPVLQSLRLKVYRAPATLIATAM